MAKDYPKDDYLIELMTLPKPEHWIPYSEQLKDPRWLWVRLEVIKRDGYCCINCFSVESLQVHHLEYLSGLLAWEYPFEYLVTLCGRCHSIEHGIIPDIDTFRPYGKSRTVKSIRMIMVEIVQASLDMIEKGAQWRRKEH